MQSMLYSMNLVYFGASVLVLMDRSYLSRFWTQVRHHHQTPHASRSRDGALITLMTPSLP